jgi:hypothetical protein
VDKKILIGRNEGKRYLGISKRRWRNNSESDLKETEYESSDGISVAATAVSGLLLEIRTSVFHKNSGNFNQLGDYKLLKKVSNQ